LSIAQTLFLSLLSITVIRFCGLWALSLSYGFLRPKSGSPSERISLIVPAYNEEKSIAQCLRSLLSLDYPDFEIIVVDDGSRDRTLEIARAIEDPRVKVLHQENGGKAEALNTGIAASTGKILLTVDADTRLNRTALLSIANRFEGHPELGALAGNVKVDEPRGLLKRVQDLEYTSSIGYIRKAQSVLGAVMIVPGPIAALRREAVEKAGGFSSATFAEDFDITLAVLREGYKVQFEDSAMAYTIAPGTVGELLKQRRRWYRGMIQVLAKNEDMLLRGRYGVAGIYGVPDMWLETIFPLINIFLMLFAVLAGYLEGQWSTVVYGLAIYWALQILVVITAVATDKERHWYLILLSPILIFYNTFLDGVRATAFIEELLTLRMKWETPAR
jgi:poly-beta-1,6 N-acetyl-D-glucosamine synthase